MLRCILYGVVLYYTVLHSLFSCHLLSYIFIPCSLHLIQLSLHALLKMGGDNHTKNWCEMIATGLTPDFSVMVTPSIMV